MSTKIGSRPSQRAAWAVAGKVNEGITTSPVTSAVLNELVEALVLLQVAMQCLHTEPRGEALLKLHEPRSFVRSVAGAKDAFTKPPDQSRVADVEQAYVKWLREGG